MVKKPGYIRVPRRFTSVPSTAQTPDLTSRLGQQLRAAKLDTMANTGYQLLAEPRSALNWRIELIQQADHTLDLQYYSWQRDVSGALLLSYVIEAADRGVRVRLLLDDIHFRGDVNAVAINKHPNIEIRLFNPFDSRRFTPLTRPLEWLTSFARVNHRMHNKLMVADNLVAICGGRNIADEYFGSSKRLNFVDLDLLVTSAAVTEMSVAFDTFWNSRWAVPVERLLTFGIDKRRARIRRYLLRRFRRSRVYRPHPLHWHNPPLEQLARAKAQVFYDLPDKISAQPDKTVTVHAVSRLWGEIQNAKHELILITPYLIPTPGLLDMVDQLVRRGVRCQFLTNSLASNDVLIAHAHYQTWRKALLAHHVTLYELSAYGTEPLPNHVFCSLHAKALVIDGEKVFIGTHNADPRSLNINTEMGLLLTSRSFAQQLRTWFKHNTMENGRAWRVRRFKKGLVWRRRIGDSSELHRNEPESRWYRRCLSKLLSLLPISHLL